MKQEALLYYSDVWLTAFALVIFFSYFCYMVYKVKSLSTDHIDKMSHMPLEEIENGRQ